MVNLTILGFDALEYKLIKEFGLSYLKQEDYGKTDISEFEKIVTPVLWGSAITGENLESEFVTEKGNQKMRGILKKPYYFLKNHYPSFAINTRKFFKKVGVLDKVGGSVFKVSVRNELRKETFLDGENRLGINVPGYNPERTPKCGMDEYIQGEVSSEEYINSVWSCFEETRKILLDNLDKEVVMAWFCPADRMGHIFRSDLNRMRETYEKLNDLAKKVRDSFNGAVLIISDHGMEKLGKFGDHSDMNYGFWSSNNSLGLKNPRFVDLKNIVEDLLNDEFNPDKYSQDKIGGKKVKDRKYSDDEKEIQRRLKELGYFGG